MEQKNVQERWAAKLKNGEVVWTDIIACGINRYLYAWSEDNSSIILAGDTKLSRQVLDIGPMELKSMREFIRRHAHPSGDVASWYGPVKPDVAYQTMSPEDLATYVHTGDISLAFRLEYKDRTLDLEAAQKSAMSFVHDALKACSDPDCEPVNLVTVTVTVNTPVKGKTQLIIAREGNGWSENELGFRVG